MTDDFLHINYTPRSSGWLLPIVAAVNASGSGRVQKGRTDWKGSELSTLGLALTTKLAFLRLVVARAEKHISALGDEIAEMPDLDEHISRGAGFAPSNRDLPYLILESIDAFIFEFRSAYEIAGKFIVRFYRDILGESIDQSKIKLLLAEGGQSLEWIEDLQEQRKRFFHEEAPWLLVRVLQREPFLGEVHLLLGAERDPVRPEQTISIARLRAMNEGFHEAMKHLQDVLINAVRGA